MITGIAIADDNYTVVIAENLRCWYHCFYLLLFANNFEHNNWSPGHLRKTKISPCNIREYITLTNTILYKGRLYA